MGRRLHVSNYITLDVKPVLMKELNSLCQENVNQELSNERRTIIYLMQSLLLIYLFIRNKIFCFYISIGSNQIKFLLQHSLTLMLEKC